MSKESFNTILSEKYKQITRKKHFIILEYGALYCHFCRILSGILDFLIYNNTFIEQANHKIHFHRIYLDIEDDTFGIINSIYLNN